MFPEELLDQLDELTLERFHTLMEIYREPQNRAQMEAMMRTTCTAHLREIDRHGSAGDALLQLRYMEIAMAPETLDAMTKTVLFTAVQHMSAEDLGLYIEVMQDPRLKLLAKAMSSFAQVATRTGAEIHDQINARIETEVDQAVKARLQAAYGSEES